MWLRLFFLEATFDFIKKPETLPHLPAMHSCGENGQPSFSLKSKGKVRGPRGPALSRKARALGHCSTTEQHWPLPPWMRSGRAPWALLLGQAREQPLLHSYSLSLSLCSAPTHGTFCSLWTAESYSALPWALWGPLLVLPDRFVPLSWPLFCE